jgi:AmmeMemoRadiSam system radical SAM enzyme/AmmeMemoRadiSam system protein B/AmmeMemoRadiSam system protein A
MSTLLRHVDLPPEDGFLPDGARLGGWWRDAEGENRIICDLCPRECHLKPGDRGFCFVRENRDGQMVLNTYGRSTGFCIDPIEKKPLNHFYPGTSVLSFGTAGCNLGCKFCQNHDISKAREVALLSEQATPEMIARAAQQLGCRSVAFTYNDPVIWAEYAIDTAKACRAAGVKAVAVTAGYITPQARGAFYEYMDAANVDLKAFTEKFYFQLTLSHLQPVLDTLEWLKKETDVWFEITNLVIPGANDTADEFRQMCDWILDHVGDDTPVHFTAFHPDYKMLDRPRTPAETLLEAHAVALRQGLKFVYVGNVHDEAHQSTYCPHCGKLLIERDWYELGAYRMNRDRCGYCGGAIAGRFEDRPGNWGRKRTPVPIARFSPPISITPSKKPAASFHAGETTVTAAAPPATRSLHQPPQLSPDQEQALHRAAGRLVAAAVLDRSAALDDPELTELAGEPLMGAFVSLKRQGRLRGCCGVMGSPIALGEAVARAARRTALEDHRLPRVSAGELPYLDLEVWLLFNPQLVHQRGEERIGAVKIGRHGLQIALGENRGLLLPGVAVDADLDAEGFLRQVSLKAGLRPDAWKSDEATLQIFEGVVVRGPLEAPAEHAPPAPQFSSEDLNRLANFCRQNVALLFRGATPSYYIDGPDGSVYGAALSLSMQGGPPLAHLSKLSLRPELPLQSTLFSLTETAAQALRSSALPLPRGAAVQMELTLLTDPAMHGTIENPDLRGFDAATRAVVVTERRKSAWAFDPHSSPEELLSRAREATEVLVPQEAAVYSFRAYATSSPVLVTTTPKPAFGPDVRPPGVAGTFYPADPAELEKQVDALFEGEAPPPVECQAIMVPHAGLKFSGKVAADVFRRVKVPETVIILGPKHTPWGVEWAVAPQRRWQLPGITIDSDPELARELVEAIPGLQLDAAAHQREHAIEIELPLLARVASGARVVGVALGAGSLEQCRRFAEGLASVLAKRGDHVLLAISTDMNHFATDEENRRLDAMALAAVETLDPETLYNTVRDNQISMCGVLPAVIVMETLRRLGRLNRCQRIAYATSADVTGDKSRVVGYAGMLFY